MEVRAQLCNSIRNVFGSRTRVRTPRTVAPCLVPKSALLQRYVGEGSYVDSYTTDIARPVNQAEFVEAFYTTPVFRLERLILRWAASKPSTDDEARALATRHADSFAAWKVEGRTGNPLLLCDFLGRTRSGLMAEPLEVAGRARTRLYFGSAVVSRGTTRHGQVRLELLRFRALLGFHKLYSRVLLSAARARLAKQRT